MLQRKVQLSPLLGDHVEERLFGMQMACAVRSQQRVCCDELGHRLGIMPRPRGARAVFAGDGCGVGRQFVVRGVGSDLKREYASDTVHPASAEFSGVASVAVNLAVSVDQRDLHGCKSLELGRRLGDFAVAPMAGVVGAAVVSIVSTSFSGCTAGMVLVRMTGGADVRAPATALPNVVATPDQRGRVSGLCLLLIVCDVLVWRNLTITVRAPAILLAIVLQMFMFFFCDVFGERFGRETYLVVVTGWIVVLTVTFGLPWPWPRLGLGECRDRPLLLGGHAAAIGHDTALYLRHGSPRGRSVRFGARHPHIGWRVDEVAGTAIVDYFLVLFGGYAMSWRGAALGLIMSCFQATQILFTAVFVTCSAAFVFIPCRICLPGR